MGSSGRRRAAATLIATAVVSSVLLFTSAPAAAVGGPCGTSGVFSTDGTTNTCTYSYTGSADSFSRPGNITSYTVKAYGAQGGSTNQASPWNVGGQGGKGALVTSSVSSLSLSIYVGQAGNSGVSSSAGGTNPFFSDFGGGSGGTSGNTISGGHGAGGGAATVVEGFNSGFFVVAGGGGGGGTYAPGSSGTGGGAGGAGGDPTGSDGGEGGSSCCSQSGTSWDLDGGDGGKGATQSAPGAGGGGGGGSVSGGSFLAGNQGGSSPSGLGRIGGNGAGGQNGGGFRTADGGGGGGGVKGGGGGGSGSGFSGASVSGGSGGGGGGGGSSQGPGGSTFASGNREGHGQVEVSWTNPPATASDDSYSTPTETALVVAAPGVLDNDSPWGEVSAVKVTDPSHGTVSLASDGSFTYTPATGYTGPDSFTYKATAAGYADSSAATVNIDVVDPVDLSLAKSCGPDPVIPGETVSCTLEVTNGGSAPATNVVVTDDVPEKLTKVKFGTTGGYVCAKLATDPKIRCTKAEEATGSSVISYTAVLSAEVGPEVAITNNASVSSDSADADTDDQSASATVNTPTCTIDHRTATSGQTIKGTSGPDVICGSAFVDSIGAGGDADVVFAGAGRDEVAGGGGGDWLFGGGGNDKLLGENGDDKMYGDDHDDTLKGGDGKDLADGRSGVDNCSAEIRDRCE